jgi:hypothetical protein
MTPFAKNVKKTERKKGEGFRNWKNKTEKQNRKQIEII